MKIQLTADYTKETRDVLDCCQNAFSPYDNVNKLEDPFTLTKLFNAGIFLDLDEQK